MRIPKRDSVWGAAYRNLNEVWNTIQRTTQEEDIGKLRELLPVEVHEGIILGVNSNETR